MNASPYPLDPRQRMTVALRADVDLRTVEKYLVTLAPIRPRTLARIEVALRSLNLVHVLRDQRPAADKPRAA